MKGHNSQYCEFWRIASVRWLTKHWRRLRKHASLAHRNLELLNRDDVRLLRLEAAGCEPPGFGYLPIKIGSSFRRITHPDIANFGFLLNLCVSCARTIDRPDAMTYSSIRRGM